MGKLRRMRARRATRLRVRPRPRCGLRSGSPSNVSAVGASLRAEIAHQARKAVPEGRLSCCWRARGVALLCAAIAGGFASPIFA